MTSFPVHTIESAPERSKPSVHNAGHRGTSADDVEAVAHALGVQDYALVGHSMGGKVAQILQKDRRGRGRP